MPSNIIENGEPARERPLANKEAALPLCALTSFVNLEDGNV